MFGRSNLVVRRVHDDDDEVVDADEVDDAVEGVAGDWSVGEPIPRLTSRTAKPRLNGGGFKWKKRRAREER